MEQAEGTSKAEAQSWETAPTPTSQGKVSPLGLGYGKVAEVHRQTELVFRLRQMGSIMSSGETHALRSQDWAEEVPPQHILFCVTLEIINPRNLTAATTTLQEFGPSLLDVQATLPLHSSGGERKLIRAFQQMCWPGVTCAPVPLL